MHGLNSNSSAVKATWLDLCLKSDTGKPIPNVHNAIEALRHDPAIRDALAFDEMSRLPMLLHRIGDPASIFEPRRPIEDADVIDLQRWMQRAGLHRVANETVRDAVLHRARERAYHPVRAYLDSIEWDGQERLNIWLAAKLGSEINPYTAEIGRMFLVSMVARIYQPGCKAGLGRLLFGGVGGLGVVVELARPVPGGLLFAGGGGSGVGLSAPHTGFGAGV
jgi:predicted P-loop ATPase